jgi:hypothetical protein
MCFYFFWGDYMGAALKKYIILALIITIIIVIPVLIIVSRIKLHEYNLIFHGILDKILLT